MGAEQIEARWKTAATSALKIRYCIEWLRAMRVPFVVHNDGRHIRILCFPDVIDIWPATSRLKIGEGRALSYDGAAYVARALRAYFNAQSAASLVG